MRLISSDYSTHNCNVIPNDTLVDCFLEGWSMHQKPLIEIHPQYIVYIVCCTRRRYRESELAWTHRSPADPFKCRACLQPNKLLIDLVIQTAGSRRPNFDLFTSFLTSIVSFLPLKCYEEWSDRCSAPHVLMHQPTVHIDKGSIPKGESPHCRQA